MSNRIITIEESLLGRRVVNGSTNINRSYKNLSCKMLDQLGIIWIGITDTVCIWPEVFDWHTPTSFIIIRPITNPRVTTNPTTVWNPTTLSIHPNTTINLTTSPYQIHPTTNQTWLQIHIPSTMQPIHATHQNTKPRVLPLPPTTICRPHILL